MLAERFVMAENNKIRRCGTMEVYNKQVESFPAYRKAQADIENDINVLLERTKSFRLDTPVTINVVVHVLYHLEEENITDEQIFSQLEVLNNDFRSKNEDLNKVPEVWKPLIADANISFKLAQQNPDGSLGNGITRTSTNTASFGTDDSMKSAATGGADPWPTDAYLNIWVCNLGESLLGYAQFPGGPPETDGVVIDYRAFGTTGTARAPFNLGRTATHEIGHYLNLSHIFGDGRGNSCADTDYVDDTPNQLGPNYQKPTFPSVSCNNGPNGDMFMNYMDYVDDDCMYMFTEGQATRMNATIYGPRATLIQT
jgi:hypothetical protein